MICIALLILIYSGCNGSGTETGDGSSDEQSTVDYSNDSGFQELFAETKNGLEETFSDSQIYDMTYEDNYVEIMFAADGDAVMLISQYNEEKWNELKSGLNTISSNVANQFKDRGYDVNVIVFLINDKNTEEALYAALNGVEFYEYSGD